MLLWNVGTQHKIFLKRLQNLQVNHVIEFQFDLGDGLQMVCHVHCRRLSSPLQDLSACCVCFLQAIPLIL